ncbi:DUF1127 domain-containing protein [Pseudomonas sp. LS44]|uniref:DUF1127 domain-containing protein n=1 Tax=Pseudomonas sp. LS44 TaxID=1357074 RepID=UPI00215A65AC|nr:DUF1127 domain-containing protein [Pseudomonas sp. LS44]UVE17956.1 DUF1127 domain-containing protein [Pseudomonas sp. LS44]
MERTLATAAPQTLSPRVRDRLQRLFACLARWTENRRTRRQLAQLDDRLLADVGITRSERLAELDKPFWK